MRKCYVGFCAFLLTAASVGVSGCGGSSHSSSVTGKGSVPTAETRARVQQLFGGSVRSLTQAGFQPSAFAASLNTAEASPSVPTAGGAAGASDASASGNAGKTSIPLVAAFLRNQQNVALSSARAQRVAAHQRAAHPAGRDEVTEPSEPTDPTVPPDPTDIYTVTSAPEPTSSFYYDYYLGLWVATDDQDGKSVYQLYVDEAKTQPAGSIVTVWPTNYETYPQTYQSSYTFTAGYLAGAHGTSNTVVSAEGVSQSSYSDTYADGAKDSGASTQTVAGNSTWTSRTDTTDGSWTTIRGSFLSNGSGGTHTEMSDGYVADSTFNADGTGREKITGPDPGLPVTIVWDAYGNTTITYADGSTQFYGGWASFGGGVAYGDDGIAYSNGTTAVDVAPTTAPSATK